MDSTRQVEDEENAGLLEGGYDKNQKISGQKKSLRMACCLFSAAVSIFFVIGYLNRQIWPHTGGAGGEAIHKDGTLAMNSTYAHKTVNASASIANHSNPDTAQEATVSGTAVAEPVTETPVAIDTEPSLLPRLTREQLLSPIDLAANNHAPLDLGGDDLSKISVLKKRFAEGRAEYVKDLKIMYGEYYEKMFFLDGRSVGRQIYHGSEAALERERFVMKMKLKLVQLQLKFLETKNPTTTLTRFVHLNGGHR
jgi:hypothetical protein